MRSILLGVLHGEGCGSGGDGEGCHRAEGYGEVFVDMTYGELVGYRDFEVGSEVGEEPRDHVLHVGEVEVRAIFGELADYQPFDAKDSAAEDKSYEHTFHGIYSLRDILYE